MTSKKPFVPRIRAKPPAVRKEELLDTAERLFITRGVDKTTVDDIVDSVGVAKGTFYVHFLSRDDLLAALKQRFVTRFAQALHEAMEKRSVDDWVGRVHAWIDAAVSYYLDHHVLHDVVFHEFHSTHPRSDHVDYTVEQLSLFLEAGNIAGAWSVGSPRLTGVLLFSALHGVLDDPTIQQMPRKRLTRHIEAFFHRALGIP